MMTKRDYQLIAKTLRECHATKSWTSFGIGYDDAWHDIVHALAIALIATNPAYNKEHFLDACKRDGE